MFLPLAREAYPSRPGSRVTPCGIRSLIEFGTLVWALVHPVLSPPQVSTQRG